MEQVTITVEQFQNGNQGRVIPRGTIKRKLFKMRAARWEEGFICSRVSSFTLNVCRIRDSAYVVRDESGIRGENGIKKIMLASSETLPKDLKPFVEEEC